MKKQDKGEIPMSIFCLIVAISLNILGKNWGHYTISGILFFMSGLFLGVAFRGKKK
jgi:hypothetical protein